MKNLLVLVNGKWYEVEHIEIWMKDIDDMYTKEVAINDIEDVELVVK